MEPKSKMEARPPALMEAVVRLLTPAACREHVLGDLCERYRSRRQYAFEALTTIPFVVASRIRRTSSVGLLTLQVIGVCVGFLTSPPFGLAAMTAAAAGALIMLLARDAYRGQRSGLAADSGRGCAGGRGRSRRRAGRACCGCAFIVVQSCERIGEQPGSVFPGLCPAGALGARRRFHASHSGPGPVRLRFSRVVSRFRCGRVGRCRNCVGISIRDHGRARHEPGRRPCAHDVVWTHLGDDTRRGYRDRHRTVHRVPSAGHECDRPSLPDLSSLP